MLVELLTSGIKVDSILLPGGVVAHPVHTEVEEVEHDLEQQRLWDEPGVLNQGSPVHAVFHGRSSLLCEPEGDALGRNHKPQDAEVWDGYATSARHETEVSTLPGQDDDKNARDGCMHGNKVGCALESGASRVASSLRVLLVLLVTPLPCFFVDYGRRRGSAAADQRRRSLQPALLCASIRVLLDRQHHGVRPNQAHGATSSTVECEDRLPRWNCCRDHCNCDVRAYTPDRVPAAFRNRDCLASVGAFTAGSATLMDEEGSDKAAFSLLLPVMKIILRGVMARTVVHLKDEIPQIVVINVDLFSALFSTYCMQNAPSLKTTGVLMTAKAIQTCVSLYDIEIVVQRMKALKKQRGVVKNVTVHSKHRNSNVDASAGTRRSSGEGRVLSSNLFALVQSSTRKLSQTIQPFKQIATSPQKTHGLLASIAPLLSEFVDNDRRGPTKETVVDATISKSVRYQPSGRNLFGATTVGLEFEYDQELRKVLSITEFVVLLNYVAVVIFLAYLFTMYHPPTESRVLRANRKHGRSALTQHTVQRVAQLRASTGFASCSQVCAVAPDEVFSFRRLSFVLEKQWRQVQHKVVFWVPRPYSSISMRIVCAAVTAQSDQRRRAASTTPKAAEEASVTPVTRRQC
ncbi:hypothetical protein ON010_g8686 [Phytophthora cinnamomi]|nr:hypothetical protein ON010_g8686 [Phytophthora cinnamomi]